MSEALRLHGYWRSSATYRIRIALGLKGLSWEHAPHHLRHGEQHAPEYKALNPQGFVPALETDGQVIVQSMAILEYLEETYPQPPLLPADARGRARVRGLAQIVACDIHPLNNLRVLKHLRATFAADEAAIGAWYNHWIAEGFAALEPMLAGSRDTGRFCHGDSPTLADVLLVPQAVNAGNYQLDLTPFPTIRRIFDACLELPAFERGLPKNQPDAE